MRGRELSALPEEETERASHHDPLLLEYDYLKHLGTISLVALGAILTSMQDKATDGRPIIMIAITLVALSAVLAFSAMNQIIQHRKSGKELRIFFRWERGIANALFASGLGLFLSELGKTLG